MGIEYSTNNYKPLVNIVDKTPFYICSLDLNKYIELEDFNRYLVYKNSLNDNYLFFYGKIDSVSGLTKIDEKILESKSKNFNNINSLIEYVKNNIKDPNLLNELSKLKKIDIKPDLDYLNRLV